MTLAAPLASAPLASIRAPLRRQIAELEHSEIGEVWRMGFEHPGVIPLWVGEGNLPTPMTFSRAAIAALEAGETFYSQKRGLPELIATLSAYMTRLYKKAIPEERITVTSSGMQAIMLGLQTIIEPGNSVVVVAPVWPNIFAAVKVVGGIVRPVALRAEKGHYQLDLDALFAACDQTTRAIFIATPGNPTGWLMRAEDQRAVLDFCRARGIWLIADEVYTRFVYDRPVAPSLLSTAEPEDPVLVINSFSKTWAMTGWRQGWITAPPALGEVFDNLIEYNTSGGQAFLQRGCIAAIKEGEPFIAESLARAKAAREIIVQRLGAMRRVSLIEPEAAFYAFFKVDGVTSSLAFAKELVHTAKVGLAPGTAFGSAGQGYLRLCFAAGPGLVSEAMDRLAPILD